MSGSPGRSRVTVTLGRGGRVVKRAGGYGDEGIGNGVPFATSKRSIRDRLGGNSDDRSQSYNKRKRGESTSNSLDMCLGKDDLRFKLMQKDMGLKSRTSEPLRNVDLRDKLSSRMSRSSIDSMTMRPPEFITGVRHVVLDPMVAGMTRQPILEPRDTSILGRFPPLRNPNDFPPLRNPNDFPPSRNPNEFPAPAPPRSNSSWTLENLRRRTPEGLRQSSLEGLRRRSPVGLRQISPQGLRRRSPEGLRRRSSEGLRQISPEDLRRRSPVGLRQISPQGLRRISPQGLRRISPEGFRQRSPVGLRGRSPVGLRGRSPVGLRGRSPVGLRGGSPVGLRGRSPVGLRGRSPVGLRGRSPMGLRRRSPVGLRQISPQGLRRMSPADLRQRSPVGMRRRSPVGMRRRSPEGLRRRSPVGLRQRSPEGVRRRSPVGMRQRSPEGLSRSLEGMRRRSPEGLRRLSPEGLRRLSPDGLRRRSPERPFRPHAVRGLSPQGRADFQRRPLNRPYDDGRSSAYARSSPRRGVQSSPYLAHSSVAAPPIKSSVPVSHYRQASGIMQRIPSGLDLPPTVDGFLQSLGLEKYAIYFKAQEVDMNALRQLGDSDLKGLGIPMGPRKMILDAIMARARR